MRIPSCPVRQAAMMARAVRPALFCLLLVSLVPAARAQGPSQARHFDGRTLTGWAVVGTGQWTVEDGALVGQGARGSAVLKSARTWANFVLRAEVRAEDGAETSIGIRCPERDHATANARSCYRVSLNDRHPLYPTGSLVDRHQTAPRMTTAREWTRVEITADGPRLVVRINGRVTADVRDERLTRGTVTIETPQRGRVRVRNFEVAPVATPRGQ